MGEITFEIKTYLSFFYIFCPQRFRNYDFNPPRPQKKTNLNRQNPQKKFRTSADFLDDLKI